MTPAEKFRAALDAALPDQSQAERCRRLGLPPRTLQRWTAEGPPRGLEEVARLALAALRVRRLAERFARGEYEGAA